MAMIGDGIADIYAKMAPPQSALYQLVNLKKAFADAQRQAQIDSLREQRKQGFTRDESAKDRQNQLKLEGIRQQTYTPTNEDLGMSPKSLASSGGVSEQNTSTMNTDTAGSLATNGTGESDSITPSGWHPSTKRNSYQLSADEANTLGRSLVSGSLVPSQLSRTQRSQAIIAAQQIDPSYNPAQADISFAANKSGTAGFEKLYNNVTSFEKTFRKNADVALQLSDKFDRTKIPLINRAIMAGKLNVTGDPEASRMATALYTVATEYARLTSAPGATGSMITDSARDEARSLLNIWQNQGTIRGQLDPETGIMSIDARNRIDALNETRNEIQSRSSEKNSAQSSKGKTITLPSGKTITLGQ